MTRFADLKRRWMEDQEFRREYDALADEFSVVQALIAARVKAGLSQEEIARRMGTTQSAIARMEGGRVKPSLRSISNYARATGFRIELRLVPNEGRPVVAG